MSHRVLFSAFGVEIEYMVVDAVTLEIRPIADTLLYDAAGRPPDTTFVSEVERGAMAWSNELALHVVEFKGNGPTTSLDPMPKRFLEEVHEANRLLKPAGATLLPTAMHPWMNPEVGLKLWPHDGQEIYEAFHRVFNCRGHGWVNLQSAHLNLPFANDEEFGRLHAAARIVLPLLPALAASSPFMDGAPTGVLDNRLAVYRSNCRRVPRVTGRVIPEPVFTREAYEREILEPMYEDIAPFDREGILRHEWLNARGAIARFERNTIEIRVLDSQETPRADVAIHATTVSALKALCSERWSSLASQQAMSTDLLEKLLLRTIKSADEAVIDDAAYLAHFGLGDSPLAAGQVWKRLIDSLAGTDSSLSAWAEPLELTLSHGPLARRLLRRFNPGRPQESLKALYRDLAEKLPADRLFD